MGSPQFPHHPSEPNATSTPGGGRPREGLLPSLPLYLRCLAILSICAGLWGAMSSLSEVNGALFLDRQAYVLRVRDNQVSILERLQKQMPATEKNDRGPGQGDFLRPFLAPFVKLPRAEAERLALLLGDALFDRRGVAVPLGLLQLILSWLLLSGAMATLRRQSFGVSTWSFACWANIFFALLNMLVTFVHSRTLMDRLGKPVSEALAQVNGHAVDFELAGLWQLTRLYVLSRAALDGFWVLVLGVSALCLQRLWLQAQHSGAGQGTGKNAGQGVGKNAASLPTERDRPRSR